MSRAQLSPRVKKLAKDFALRDGHFCLTDEKLKSWVSDLSLIPETERKACATEILALAMRFEEEGGEPAGLGAAQLYYCAAGLIEAKGSRGSGGWGAAPKR